MNRLGFGLVVALVALAATSALALGDIRGNGKKITQVRQVPAFTAVRAEGSLDVTVQVGPAPSVAVTIDENLQPEVETAVQGDTLVIRVVPGHEVSWRGDARVAVTVPNLTALTTHGSGDAVILGAAGGDARLVVDGSGDLRWNGKAAHLHVCVEGSGDVELAGQADALEVSIDGSGDVDAKALTATAADLSVNGSGDIGVTLSGGPLKAQVNGSGDIHWRGSASAVQAVTQGSGDIEED